MKATGHTGKLTNLLVQNRSENENLTNDIKRLTMTSNQRSTLIMNKIKSKVSADKGRSKGASSDNPT